MYPSSSVKSAQWVVYNELIKTANPYLRTVTMVEGSWLAEFAPAYFDISSFPEGRMKAELVFVYSSLLGVWVCLLDEGGSDHRVESVSRYSIGCVTL